MDTEYYGVTKRVFFFVFDNTRFVYREQTFRIPLALYVTFWQRYLPITLPDNLNCQQHDSVNTVICNLGLGGFKRERWARPIREQNRRNHKSKKGRLHSVTLKNTHLSIVYYVRNRGVKFRIALQRSNERAVFALTSPISKRSIIRVVKIIKTWIPKNAHTCFFNVCKIPFDRSLALSSRPGIRQVVLCLRLAVTWSKVTYDPRGIRSTVYTDIRMRRKGGEEFI